jgi:hypothetical protein
MLLVSRGARLETPEAECGEGFAGQLKDFGANQGFDGASTTRGVLDPDVRLHERTRELWKADAGDWVADPVGSA